MFGVVHKLDRYTITLAVQECAKVKLTKLLLCDDRTPLKIGMQVYFDVEVDGKTYLPKLALIRAQDFDNCSRCGKGQDFQFAQIVSIVGYNFTTLT